WLSLGGSKLADRLPKPGSILLSNQTPAGVSEELKKMGYKISTGSRTSGPINAILFDWKHGSLWGGSSNNGEDYGIGW
ncbi:MAG TPA: gamma-glutamyltransferase family protein, partial [Sediminibacterium sp.]